MENFISTYTNTDLRGKLTFDKLLQPVPAADLSKFFLSLLDDDFSKTIIVKMCNLCGVDLDLHIERHGNQVKFTCCNCGKSMACSRSLQRHISMHLPPMTVACPVCSKLLSSKSSLKAHLTTHNDVKPFECDLCSKSFRLAHKLKCHLEYYHTKSTTHTCEICGFVAVSKVTLGEHKKQHFNDFKIKCDICGKGCYSKNQLKEHQYKHTGEKPYVCEICGKKFPYRNNYVFHKKSHDPNSKKKIVKLSECETCGKVFTAKARCKLT